MAYENRWNERDRHEQSHRFGGDEPRWESGDRGREEERARGWRPFGDSGPSNYDRAGVRADNSRGDYRPGGREGGETYGRSANRSAWTSDSDYGQGRDRDVGRGLESDREGGFGETGGRYSESFREQDRGHGRSGAEALDRAGEGARRLWDKATDRVQSWFGDDDRRGEHRGRGPKGYRRSDERIRDDVSDRLSDDSWLDASDIEVRVDNSEVTLDGTVSSRDDKRRAEDLAERVSGVDHVQNNLRVRRQGDALATTAAATLGGATSSFGQTNNGDRS
jgi:osmotically-inducible protein OsmY